MATGRRSYGQYCGLARALDVVSGRWSLLIVRELLVGPARYNQLQAGLPGISPKLLADRLRELEEAGVVERHLTAENAVEYALTSWGVQLREPIAGLVNWSTPLMVAGPQGDHFQAHWLVVALESLLKDRRRATPASIGIEVEGVVLEVRIDETGPHVATARAQPCTVLRAEPQIVLGLATGMLTVEQAVGAGQLAGTKQDLQRVFVRA